MTEEVTIEGEKKMDTEKPSVEDDASDGNKEKPTNEPEEKEPEVKVYPSFSMLKPKHFPLLSPTHIKN